MSQIKTALEKAGYTPPSERLKKVAEGVLASTNYDVGPAKSLLINAIQGDAELLMVLFEPYCNLAIQKLLSDLKSDEVIRRRKETAKRESAEPGGGQSFNTNQNGAAPASNRPTARQPNELVQRAAIGVAKKTILDTLIIDGVRLADCTVSHARSWGKNREREGRFITMALANMPPDDLVGKWLKPNEAQELWARAQLADE